MCRILNFLQSHVNADKGHSLQRRQQILTCREFGQRAYNNHYTITILPTMDSRYSQFPIYMGSRGEWVSCTGIVGLQGSDFGESLGGSSHSPGVVDAKCNFLSPKTVCAWWRAISYARWPCHAEHSGYKGVNLEKQSPILRCVCRAYGMNGSGLVCLERHTPGYQATSRG